MNQTQSVLSYKVITVDFCVVFLLLYIIPSLSHLTAIPFYLMDPMRITVLGSFLFLKENKYNALLLAISLPLVSFLFSGHPVFPKYFLISMELAINILLISFLTKRSDKVFILVLVSIILSKIAYYMAKWLLIIGGVFSTTIVDTNLLIQLLVAIFLSSLYSKYYKH